jgi:hypothetical protein
MYLYYNKKTSLIYEFDLMQFAIYAMPQKEF